jgi:hypothetical protein
MNIKSEIFRKLKNSIGGRLHRVFMCVAYLAAFFLGRIAQITKIMTLFHIAFWIDGYFEFKIWDRSDKITPEILKAIRENMDHCGESEADNINKPR